MHSTILVGVPSHLSMFLNRIQFNMTRYSHDLHGIKVVLRSLHLKNCNCSPPAMAHYRPSHRRSSYASGTCYPSTGLTYDPDEGFSAVDPFKPSIAYSLQNMWAPEILNTDDLHVIPPIRRRFGSPHQQTGIQISLGAAGTQYQ